MSKSKFETHVLPYLDRIADWTARGATAKEIAGKLHIAYSTFRKYLDEGEKGNERYTALVAAFVRACEEPDDNVEAALYKRACGFEYEEVKVEERVNPKTGEVYLLTTRTAKLVPPDPNSMMFWLTNRRPGRWRYKPDAQPDDEDGSGGVIVLPPVMPGQEPQGACERAGDE